MEKNMTKKSYEVFLKRYVSSLKEKGIKESVIANRQSVIQKFFEFLANHDEKIAFKDIERYHVDRFITEQESSVSIATVGRYFSFLKKFFLYYKKENENTNNIFDYWSYGKHIEKNYVFLNEEELNDIYNSIRSNENPFRRMRDEVIFLILVYTGCASGEVRNLNYYKSLQSPIYDQNYYVADERRIYFYSEDEREIELTQEIANKIEQYIKYCEEQKGHNFTEKPYLFPSFKQSKSGRITVTAVYEIIKPLIKNSEVIRNKNISVKNIRHTFIKGLIDKDVSLEIISSITGLELASLKYYLDEEKIEKQKTKILKEYHPFSEIIKKIE